MRREGLPRLAGLATQPERRCRIRCLPWNLTWNAKIEDAETGTRDRP